MSHQKYSVQIEDLPEEVDSQIGSSVESNMHKTNKPTSCDQGSNYKQQEAWNQVDRMENQARNEKMEDASDQMKKAHKMAHIVEKDIQQQTN
ncbi:unnamed protein product [Absidia cylindrospora]